MDDFAKKLVARAESMNIDIQESADAERAALERAETESRQRELEVLPKVQLLAQQCVGALVELDVPTVPVYGRAPKTEANQLTHRTGYSYANAKNQRKREKDILELLNPTDTGWVVTKGSESYYEGNSKWIFGLDTNGRLLTDFDEIQLYHRQNLHNCPDRRLTGIIRPRRVHGQYALTVMESQQFQDGLASLIGGNGPLQFSVSSGGSYRSTLFRTD